MHPLIESHRAEIRALAAKHGVTDVRVYESMAHEDATAASDVICLCGPCPARACSTWPAY